MFQHYYYINYLFGFTFYCFNLCVYFALFTSIKFYANLVSFNIYNFLRSAGISLFELSGKKIGKTKKIKNKNRYTDPTKYVTIRINS